MCNSVHKLKECSVLTQRALCAADRKLDELRETIARMQEASDAKDSEAEGLRYRVDYLKACTTDLEKQLEELCHFQEVSQL